MSARDDLKKNDLELCMLRLSVILWNSLEKTIMWKDFFGHPLTLSKKGLAYEKFF